MLNKKKKLLEAARNNDVAGVEKNFKSGKACWLACMEAAQNNAPDALHILLEKNKGFNFSNFDGNLDRPRAGRLLNTALEADASEEIISVLYEANKSTLHGRLDRDYFIVKKTPAKIIKDYLEYSRKNYKLGGYERDFAHCIDTIGLSDTDKLKFILTFMLKTDGERQALTSALRAVAGTGDVEKADLLLRYGANANYAGAGALFKAVKAGDLPMVERLLPNVTLQNHGEDIAKELRKQDADPAVIEVIEAATQIALSGTSAKGKPISQTQSTSAAPDNENYVRLDDNTLASIQRLPDGGTIVNAFRFDVEQQQVSINGGTPAIVAFKDIGKKHLDALRETFNALAPAQEQSPANENAEKKPELASQDIAKRLNGAGI